MPFDDYSMDQYQLLESLLDGEPTIDPEVVDQRLEELGYGKRLVDNGVTTVVFPNGERIRAFIWVHPHLRSQKEYAAIIHHKEGDITKYSAWKCKEIL